MRVADLRVADQRIGVRLANVEHERRAHAELARIALRRLGGGGVGDEVLGAERHIALVGDRQRRRVGDARARIADADVDRERPGDAGVAAARAGDRGSAEAVRRVAAHVGRQRLDFEPIGGDLRPGADRRFVGDMPDVDRDGDADAGAAALAAAQAVDALGRLCFLQVEPPVGL